MSAVFFRKKIIWVSVVLLSCFICVGVYLYTQYLDRATVEAVSQNYYFLVADTTHVEASAVQVVLDGGAGYILELEEGDFVTISVYTSKEDAENVQKNLQNDTSLISLSVENLYFKSEQEKKSAKKIVGAFHTLSDCIEVLSNEISRMEKGGTQESCKRILETLKNQFVYLGKEYGGILPAYKEVCEKTANSLQVLIDDIVFVSDLRNLQCDLCYSYVRLAEDFSL